GADAPPPFFAGNVTVVLGIKAAQKYAQLCGVDILHAVARDECRKIAGGVEMG
ncbi:hypothetical protein DXG01_013573, partial [Tephrocybe rancida]